MDTRPGILCVDDEPLNIRLLEALLEPRGYRVLGASGGELEALRLLLTERVDLVLLDLMMPVMDGFQVCRRIKGDERTRQMPVILLTALAGREDRIRGIESGADDFITKPFDKGEVLARVQMLLKVKTLNERLNSAYQSIVHLIETAGELVRTFDAISFDFRSSVDAFVSPIVRREEEDLAKPETAAVGFPTGGEGWTWRIYRGTAGGLARTEIHPDYPAGLQPFAGSSLEYFNRSGLESPEAGWLPRALHLLSLEATNAVCWRSPELCVFLLNYGKEISVYDARVLEGLVTQSLFLRSLSLQVNETENAFAYTVAALARAAEANDEDTGNHIQRVGAYCSALAEQMGLPDGYVRAIRLQAQMHDVGKIHIRADILKKNGELTPEEWLEMQKHALYGAQILGDHPRLKMAKAMALSHHEKWDGSGYPFGLRGEEIPIEGRIIGIADQYDALRSQRLYKPPLDHMTTVRILTEGRDRTSPKHFDPRVLAAFSAIHHKFPGIYERLLS